MFVIYESHIDLDGSRIRKWIREILVTVCQYVIITNILDLHGTELTGNPQ